MSVLHAAEAWGIPPWQITGDGDPLLWMNRRAFLAEQQAIKANPEAYRSRWGAEWERPRG